MKQTITKLLSYSSTIFPISFYKRITDKYSIHPFYHIVSNKVPAHVKHLYSVRNTKQFEKDLDFFMKQYRSADYKDFNNKAKNKFYLSFDDGLQEFYTIIAPILKKRKIKATIFINSNFVDNKGLFFKYKASILVEQFKNNSNGERLNKISEIFEKKITAQNFTKEILSVNYKNVNKIDETAKVLGVDFNEYLKKEKPYLTKEQLNELADDGFAIGAHSRKHPLFSDISLQEQIVETAESINFVNNNFKILNKLFAFPFTDDGVSKEYFENIFTDEIADFTFGTAGIKDDCIEKNIQRIPIEKTNISAERYVKLQYLFYFLKRLLNKQIIMRY